MNGKGDLIKELNLKLKESESAFNELRDELINEAFDRSQSPEKLKQLQWRIDGLMIQSTKLGAVVKLSQMMNDSFIELRDELNKFS